MITRIKKWFSLKLAEKPSTVVLLMILFFNLILITLTALIISSFNLKGTEGMGFFEAAFYTVSMIFDAGCISYVVADIGSTSVFIVVLCLIVIVVGMITFTGSLIGYATNVISSFLEDANNGEHKLFIDNHIVILNWNNKACEIIYDLQFKDEKSIVVVLSESDKEKIEKELADRLPMDNKGIHHKNLKVIVRNGSPYSLKQLEDISIKTAKTIIILDSNGDDSNNIERQADSTVVKTLMQVGDLCSSDDSLKGQVIIVETTNEWTYEIVEKIADFKKNDGKCEIVSVPVNKIMGKILSQLTIMPELNHAYKELFSYSGAEFYCKKVDYDNKEEFIDKFIDTHKHAIPIGFVNTKYGENFYCVSNDEKDIDIIDNCSYVPKKLELNKKFSIANKNIVVLGHNHNYKDIIDGFDAYYHEWGKKNKDIISITIIDDEENIKRNAQVLKKPFIKQVVKAKLYEKDKICKTIDKALTKDLDTSILILSDDREEYNNMDVYPLTSLVYVQNVIKEKREKENYDSSMVDIIVEIINPKHYGIIKNYSINNIVISNKFISKMIMQVGEKKELYEFFEDILTYDGGNNSKEIYIKSVKDYFKKIPDSCSQFALLRDLYYSTKEFDPTILLGLVKNNGKVEVFGGDQESINIKLEEDDKLIVCSNH